MPTNQFVPVATGSGANVRTYSQWAGTAVQVTGVQTGIVASKDMNTAWRQGTTMASVLGQMIVNRIGIDATDDGNVPGLLANVERGIAAMLDPARYAVDGGQLNTLVASLSPAPVALGPFAQCRVRVAYTNTSTTPTLNLNGFGPLTIVRQDGSALAVGDLQANRIAHFVYDNVANAWRIGGPAASDLLGATYITTAITKNVGGTGADFANLNAAFAWLSNYRITLAGSVTFQLATGQFVYNSSIYFNHPDGLRVSVVGQTLKTAQPVGSVLSFTGTSASARATDKTTNLATMRGVYASEIVLQGGAQFTGNGQLGNLQDVLISSDGSNNADGILWGAGSLTFTRIAVIGTGQRGVVLSTSFASVSGICYALGCATNGWSVNDASVLSANAGATIVGSGNGTNGITTIFGRVGSIVPNAGATTYTRGNGRDGVYASGGSIQVSNTSISRDNAAAGFDADNNASMNADSTQSISNNNGYVASGCSYLVAPNSSGANTTYGYVAVNGANILRTGGTATGATANATPAVGSTGGNNSFIS
jgi:hypothetical protein